MLPAVVDIAGSVHDARELASLHRHELWIIDAHLPDGSGLDCLGALSSLHAQVPALAITAGVSTSELDALCAGGFLEVLMKPVSIAQLQGTVRRVLALGAVESAPTGRDEAFAPLAGKQPVWEQERALAAIGGNATSLGRLREIFLADLPAQRAELALAQETGDVAAVRGLVHKLRAACGFVGAARLAQAVEMVSVDPLGATALEAFEHAAEDTLATQP